MMASVGQTPAQAPQSWHLSGSIQRIPSFSEIASTGHSPSQAPQFTQASVTLYAMKNLANKVGYEKIAHFLYIMQGPFQCGDTERG
jgi:hypothetical protein